MSRFKTTWILAALLCVLMGYVYWGEVRGTKKKELKKEAEETVLLFDKSKVDSLTLRNSKGTFKVKRMGEDDWILENPLRAKGDKLSWNSILEALHGLKFTRVISESETNLEPYGLQKPKMEVDVLLSDRKEVLNLRVGEDNPVGDSLFVMRGDSKKVLLAAKGIAYTLDKDLKELREKKLFTFKAEKIQEVEIQRDKNRFVLKKEGEKWWLASKEKKELELSKVKELLNAVVFLEVSKFEEEAPTDLAKYGLSTPQITFLVRDDKTTQLELLFGKSDKDGVYVMKKAEKPVYRVGTYTLNRIPSDPSSLIKKEEKKVSPSKK